MNFYKVTLSNKQEFEIDEEDYTHVLKAVSSGTLVKTKQAIFNPSYLVAIVPIKKQAREKIEGYMDEEKKVFVVTKEETIEPTITETFKKNEQKTLPEPSL